MSRSIHLPKRSENWHQYYYFRLTQSCVNEDVRLGLISKKQEAKWHEVLDRWDTLVYVQNGSSGICKPSFRIILNRGPLKISCSQYALEPIFRPFFAGVVYGASLTCCGIVRNGVIRRWQRLKCKWFHGLGMQQLTCTLTHPKTTYVPKFYHKPI